MSSYFFPIMPFTLKFGSLHFSLYFANIESNLDCFSQKEELLIIFHLEVGLIIAVILLFLPLQTRQGLLAYENFLRSQVRGVHSRRIQSALPNSSHNGSPLYPKFVTSQRYQTGVIEVSPLSRNEPVHSPDALMRTSAKTITSSHFALCLS